MTAPAVGAPAWPWEIVRNAVPSRPRARVPFSGGVTPPRLASHWRSTTFCAVRRLLSTVALGFAWLCANGAIWDVAQVVAWGRMFANYSETMSMGAALAETLDPAKPCPLCLSVAAAKGKSRSEASLPGGQRDVTKIVLTLQWNEPPVFSPPRREWGPVAGATGLLRRERVPVPPPRG